MSAAVVSAGGVGFCGALTTYSGFGYATVRLVEDGTVLDGCPNALASRTAGLGAALRGLTIASAVRP